MLSNYPVPAPSKAEKVSPGSRVRVRGRLQGPRHRGSQREQVPIRQRLPSWGMLAFGLGKPSSGLGKPSGSGLDFPPNFIISLAAALAFPPQPTP